MTSACSHASVCRVYHANRRTQQLDVKLRALRTSAELRTPVKSRPFAVPISVSASGAVADKAAEMIAPRLAKLWWTRIVALPESTQPDTVERGVLEELLGRRER